MKWDGVSCRQKHWQIFHCNTYFLHQYQYIYLPPSFASNLFASGDDRVTRKSFNKSRPRTQNGRNSSSMTRERLTLRLRSSLGVQNNLEDHRIGVHARDIANWAFLSIVFMFYSKSKRSWKFIFQFFFYFSFLFFVCVRQTSWIRFKFALWEGNRVYFSSVSPSSEQMGVLMVTGGYIGDGGASLLVGKIAGWAFE